jgi:thioredoxin 1
MKTLLFYLSVSALLLQISCNQTATDASLEPQAFADKIGLPNTYLLDVRTPGEFEEGHIENAINIDWNGSTFSEQTMRIDKSKTLLVYCQKGGRSAAAASALRKEGFTVFELKGGLSEWRSEGLPESPVAR